MTGLYIVIGVLIAVMILLAYLAIKPVLKKYKVVEIKPKKKRAKRSTNKKTKHLWIKVI